MSGYDHGFGGQEAELAMCHEATVRLVCEAASARQARRFVIDRLREWGLSHRDPAFDLLETAAVVTTELAANAPRFCADKFSVELHAHHDAVEINVSDDSETRPAPVKPHRLPPPAGA